MEKFQSEKCKIIHLLNSYSVLGTRDKKIRWKSSPTFMFQKLKSPMEKICEFLVKQTLQVN